MDLKKLQLEQQELARSLEMLKVKLDIGEHTDNERSLMINQSIVMATYNGILLKRIGL